MAIFRKLVFTALCAGLLAGVFAAAAHQIATVPVILAAESYEQPAAAAHEPGAAWQPESRAERAAYALLADVLTGIGFGLLLAAGLSMRGGETTWRQGLSWGLAGFAAFTLAPGLGLPPQLPGAETAPLLARQLWWLGTAAATAGGLGLFAFTKHARWAVLATVLIVLPHLYGAPQPLEPRMAAPAAVVHHFVVAVTVVNFLFWIVLGALTGCFYEWLEMRAGVPARVR
jgi:cobalt transporter subunit CbtA